MSIRIVPYRGGYRPYWYAEYKENGKTHQIRLTERIAGVPPKSLSIKDEGSVLYEKSKAKALAEFEAFENERKRKGSSERLMEELIASKTGKKIVYHKVKDIGILWNSPCLTLGGALPPCRPREQALATAILFTAGGIPFCATSEDFIRWLT